MDDTYVPIFYNKDNQCSFCDIQNHPPKSFVLVEDFVIKVTWNAPKEKTILLEKGFDEIELVPTENGHKQTLWMHPDDVDGIRYWKSILQSDYDKTMVILGKLHSDFYEAYMDDMKGKEDSLPFAFFVFAMEKEESLHQLPRDQVLKCAGEYFACCE